MKINIEATEKLTNIDGVPVRLWKGTTDSGIPCHVFVHRIAVSVSESAADFERELKEQVPPGVAIPLRNIL